MEGPEQGFPKNETKRKIKMFLPGEEMLAEKILNLVKTARQQEATIPEQGKILHQMGEVYLGDAIETGDMGQFVKASALINGALVRTENTCDQKTLQEMLCKLHNVFLGNIHETPITLKVKEFVDKTNKNKDNLHALRVEVDNMSENIKQFFDTYSSKDYWGDDEDGRTEIEERLVMDAKNVSFFIQNRMIKFVNQLWEQAMEMYTRLPPCKYAIIGLGSMARQDMTPYSDMEFALLIEEDSDDIKQFFKNLVNLFHLLVLDLGETPIPEIGIESLNDYQTPGGDKFFDRITPRGFRLDGAMPWACKTPIGRKKTLQRGPLDLMKTPKEMAELQKEDSLGQAYHVADVLSNSILIYGDSELFKKYRSLYAETVSKIDHREKAKNTLIDDYRKSPDFRLFCNFRHFYRNKTFLFRFPSTFVENLRMYFTPCYQSNSAWNVIEHLLKVNILSWEGAFNLKVQLAICFGFRLLTYFKNKGQYENIGFMFTKEIPLSKERPQNPLKTRKSPGAAYFKQSSIVLKRVEAGHNALRHVVENHFINSDNGKVNSLKNENFIYLIKELEPYPSFWSRNKPMLTNLTWARSSGELPPRTCGKMCGAHELVKFSYLHSNDYRYMFHMIDAILAIRGCRCLSLIRTSLLVSKAVLILDHNQVGMVPKEANIVKLQEKYRQKMYKNVRERFYLLIDFSDLAKHSIDKKKKLSVIEDIKAFLDDVTTLDCTQKTIFEVTRDHIVESLICLYLETGQPERSFLHCEQLIDEYGEELGFDYLGHLYYLYGNVKRKCNLEKEALYYYRKAFEAYRLGYENEENEYSSASLLAALRLVACEISQVNNDRKEVCDVLEAAFTRNGKSFNIKTNLDIEGMFLLWNTSERTKRRCNCYSSQYFEEILTLIIIEGSGNLKPETVLITVKLFVYSIAVFAAHKTELPFTKEFIKSIYQDCNISKEDFLIAILDIFLEDESIPRYFLGREHFKVNEPKVYSENFFCTWIGYFFMLCFLSLTCAKRLNIPCLVIFKIRLAILKQILYFCEKVVKKCASKTVYEMCLMFIEYNKIRYFVSISAYIKDLPTLKYVLTSALDLHRKIVGFLDNKTHPITDINWFNHRFLELVMKWPPFTRRFIPDDRAFSMKVEDFHTDPRSFILKYFEDFRS